jgi:hypothetical protein
VDWKGSTAPAMTGDAFARLGAPAGASVSADVAAVKAETATILADTAELQTDWVNGGRLDLLVDGIKAKTDNLPSDPADASVIAGRFDTLDTNLATVDTVVDAVKAKTDNLPSDPADASVVAGLIAAAEAKIDIIDTNVDAILVDTSTTLQAELDGIQADTEDIQSKIGTPAGVSVSADIAAVKSDTAAILVDTGTTLDGKIDTIDTVADAIKAKTDSLTFTQAGAVDANITYVNETAVGGTGALGDEWGPA